MSDREQKIFVVALVVLLSLAQIISTRYGVWLQIAAIIGKLLPSVTILYILTGTFDSITDLIIFVSY